MGPLELVQLTSLMQRTSGRAEIKVALIDGPVAMNHPDLAGQNIKEIARSPAGACLRDDSAACIHGTFVAGVLFARRGSIAPAICPDCTLLTRPIFSESPLPNGKMPRTKPAELASAIVETVNDGARVVNLSAALAQPSATGESALRQALDYAARNNVIIVAAAGNQGTVSSSVITRHPWVISVVSCDLQGRPTTESNLGGSIGQNGLAAPGENIVSIGSDGHPAILSGTSAATPFVTGAIALLWSERPNATAAQIKLAVTQGDKRPRTIVPPLMNAWAAHAAMSLNESGRSRDESPRQ
jgi:subtilisin family serine protease